MSVLADYVKAAVNEALERTGGERTLAAELLGWTTIKLKDTINKNTELKLRWGKSEQSKHQVTAPNEVEVLSRTEDPEPEREARLIVDQSSARDRALAAAMEEEDRKLRTGLAGLGLKKNEQELALNLQAFGNRQFRHSIEIIQAGVTRVSLKLQTQLDDIAARLEYVRQQIGELENVADERRQIWIDEEKNLMAGYVAVSDQMRKIMEIANKGALTAAMIRFKCGKGPKAAKPGFQPVLEA